MHQIQLTITAKSPLAIGGRKPGGSVSETENYITGSVIRGTIANLLVDLANQNNNNLAENGGDFQQLFLDENAAIFQNAYPVQKGKEKVRIMPTTAVSSKTKPGFKTKDGYGVFDTLIDRFCAEKSDRLYDPNCPYDGGRVEPFSGFYYCNYWVEAGIFTLYFLAVNKMHLLILRLIKDYLILRLIKDYRSLSVSTRLLTRVGINRRRATSEDQLLYSIHVINEVQGKEREPTTFIGAILLEDEPLAESLKNFINSHKKSLRFGSSTSRGLGKVEIESVLTEIKSDVKTRADRFNKKLKERWNQWQIFNPGSEGKFNEERTYFTINLQSDAILIENWRRTTVITEAMLKQFADVEDGSLELEVAYSSYDYFCGWNAAWGLQKDTDLIVNKGGVYLFSTENFNLWEEKLARLEVRGVGEKTCEGFGQIEICNEFHLVLREDAV